MPELDDARALVPLAAADLASDDLLFVYDASTGLVRKVTYGDFSFSAGVTTGTVLTALMGAEADPDRIGAEYMPEEIDVNNVTLANQAAIVLSTGQIATDDNGRVIVGNGVRNVEVGSSSRFRVFNAIHVPAATIIGGTTYQELGRFKLRADEWVLGQRAAIVGRVSAQASAAYAGTAIPGMRPSNATDTATSDGFKFFNGSSLIAASGAPATFFPQAFVQFKAGSGAKIGIDEDVSTEIISGIKLIGDSTAVNIVTGNNSSASPSLANGATAGLETDIIVYLNLTQDATFNAAGYVRASCDLQLILLQ